MKKNKIKIYFTTLALGCFSYINMNAQVDLTINGLGRSILTNNHLQGKILNSDTATARKGLSGYNLFDLGFGLAKGREFQSNIIMRVRQNYGDFWGEGTKFEFRQLQIKGDLNWLSYEIGDIDVKNTPYTVHNYDEIFNRFEAPVFKARRDIVNYENFTKDNVWRLQGVKLGTEWYLGKKNFETIRLNAFGVRTNVTDNSIIPDRILIGARLDAMTTDKYTIAANYVGLQDIALDTYPTHYQNHVLTGLLDIWAVRKEKIKIGLFTESGISNNNYSKKTTDSTYKSNDFFVDGGLKAELSKGFYFKISYKNVGAKYSSPSAQTTRVNISTSPLLFSSVLNSTTARTQLLFDRFTQEKIYNRGIMPVLQLYNPMYNNVTPYGEATPNRMGYTVELGNKKSDKFEIMLQARMLSEIVGEGSINKRNFFSGLGGVKVGIGALANIERRIDLYLGGRYENTDRSGGGVNLQSSLIDAGITFQLFKQLDLVGGAKMLTAKGNEIIAIRNDINVPVNYIPITINAIENTWAYGIRINFNETTNFNVNHTIAQNQNKQTPGMSYTINQLFMNFNIMF
jgi:hypothetical protein